ncbi:MULTISPECIES: crotonase/enoyl-CoA hydratase family protein [unclassified Acinetobacter]|uniref:crotonase/enoyl-CoA hydratase family protein n=1 Tax=unclassified Acinetobacter TaxID=196816 RepID=UPI0035B7AC2B
MYASQTLSTTNTDNVSDINFFIDENSIAYVTLQRLEKRNALSFAMLQTLLNIADQIGKNRDIRAVILTGGEHFSAGIDTESFQHKNTQRFALWQLLKPQASLFQQACLVWQQLPIPVICAVQGYCFGAGVQLALGADIRIAHPNSQWSIMETKIGLVADMGISQTLQNHIGLDHAKELAMTARIIDAKYAEKIGLVTHIDEQPLQYAKNLALEISQRSPDAVMASKKVLNASQYHNPLALAVEKYYQVRLFLGKNQKLALKKLKDSSVEYQKRFKF